MYGNVMHAQYLGILFSVRYQREIKARARDSEEKCTTSSRMCIYNKTLDTQ